MASRFVPSTGGIDRTQYRRCWATRVLDVQELYESHLDRVYAFFAYRVTSVVDAEDLASMTFERVVRHASRFDSSRASATTWLFAISENVLIDHYRRQGRRDERDFEDHAEHWRAPEDRPSIGVSPELHRALAGLSDRERRVIGLRFGADLSGKEIAEVIGTTEANAHQVLSRALRRMRSELGDVSPVR
jgi:RNA polymerase sigma-70 factor (ECF subfamily)